MSQGIRTLSVDDAERFTKNDFSVRQSRGTNGFWMSVFFLATILWLGAILLGFFGDHLPIPPEDFSWQRKAWLVYRRFRGFLHGVRFIAIINLILTYAFFRIAKKQFAATRSGQNWLVRAGPTGLYVKYRSYLANTSEPAGVLFLSRSCVQSVQGEIRVGWTAVSRPGRHRNLGIQGQKKIFLKIIMTDDANGEVVENALKAERSMTFGQDATSSRKSIRTTFIHFPVSLQGRRDIRIELDCSPKQLNRLLQSYAKWFSIGETSHVEEMSIDSMKTEMIWQKIEQSFKEGDEDGARLLLKVKLNLDAGRVREIVNEYRKEGNLNAIQKSA